MTEPRTARDARLAVREIEKQANEVRMSPACAENAYGWSTSAYYLRRAQAALRQAERAFAKVDDPRLDDLKPLSPQVEPSRRQRSQRRRRYRCAVCFEERLEDPERVKREPRHYHMKIAEGRYVRDYCGDWEIVPPLRRKKTKS